MRTLHGGNLAAFVAVEGSTGAGKTTLATRLAALLDAVAVLDPFEQNPFLPRLVAGGAPAEDPELALRVELTFLALRIAQLRRVDALLATGRGVVADWALLKQPIFAATTLEPADVARIAATVQVWAESVPTPDLVIGLTAPASVLHRRVRQRGRDLETAMIGVQLEGLSAAFEHAYTSWDGPLIRLDTTVFDVFNGHHVHELADQVRQLPTLLESR